MNCEGQRTLFLRASGALVCQCDAGQQVQLGQIGNDRQFDINEFILGPKVTRMRERMAAGAVPWPLVCERCAFFRPDEPLASSLSGGMVTKVQVETTLACNLQCPGCSGRWQVKNLPGPATLTLEKFEALLRSCSERHFQVDWIEYCGQGEPLVHPQFPKLLDAGSRTLPRALQRVITNGNFDFDDRFPDQLPDELMVSCDGFYQASYEQYRVRGNVERVLTFMRRAVIRAASHKNKRVVWKYILFSNNDSDHEIAAAQNYATSIGVDRILFVMTHTKNRSRRFYPGSDQSIPITSRIAVFNSTPVLYGTDIPSGPESDARPDRNGETVGEFIHVVIDELVELETGSFIKGWAVGNYGRAATEIWLTDERGDRHSLQAQMPRNDVARALPQWRNDLTGFGGTTSLPTRDVRKCLLVANIDGHYIAVRLDRHTPAFKALKFTA
jgi:hypothetical protein